LIKKLMGLGKFLMNDTDSRNISRKPCKRLLLLFF
jgi:hypothetical protein